MRFLVISDIHANLSAFEAVLAEARGQWDKIWFLGDLVGYGPDPNECIALLRQQEHLALSGNHDWAVLDRLDIYSFNPDARAAIGWTQSALTNENRDYLAGLPTMVTEGDHFTLAHASPRHPVWEYILDPDQRESRLSGRPADNGHRRGPLYAGSCESAHPVWEYILGADGSGQF
jgi:hypothetical protein